MVQKYLSDRLQYVEIGGVSSHMLPITCGVPQGSILDLLLFLIYVNDLPMCSKFVKFIVFADNTNIFFTDKSIDYCCKIFNNELINLSEWFKAIAILFLAEGKIIAKMFVQLTIL